MVGPVSERLPPQLPDELGERQLGVYRAITQGPRSQGPRLFETTGQHGELLGPFAAMVAHPAVGDPLQRLGAALRYETSLPDVAREVVILTVAAHHRSEYEWYAHSAVAAHIGLPAEVVEALRGGGEPRDLDEEARYAWQLAVLLLRREPLVDDTFAAVESALGSAGLIEVTALVGYYSLLAQLIEVFRLDPPEGTPPQLGGR
jgi:4-carboxymuconolactone decarboxylase